MANRKKSKKILIDNDYFYGMGEYADSYQGGMINPFSERSVPRSPSQALLTTKYDLAANRSSEVNGGFVHRPVQYRGIGAGMNGCADNYEGGNRFMDELKRGFSKKNLTRGFKKLNEQVLTPMATTAKFVAPLFGPEALPVSAALGALGYGKPKRINQRAMIVKKVMNERGVSMIEASKIVKKEGLY